MGGATSSHWEGKPLVCFTSGRSGDKSLSQTVCREECEDWPTPGVRAAQRRSRGQAECQGRASLSSPAYGAEMPFALGHLATGSQPGERVCVVCNKVVLRQPQQEVTDYNWRNI